MNIKNRRKRTRTYFGQKILYVVLIVYFILAGHFRIYNDPIFKIIVPILIIALAIFYFIKRDYLSYIKLAIIVVFIGHQPNQYVMIFINVLLFNKKLLLPYNSPMKYIYLLIGWGFLSYILNQFVEINLLAFPAFFASFFLAISFFTLFYKNSNERFKNEIVELFHSLVLMVITVSLFQFFILGASIDKNTGGTTSSHKLGFIISISFLLIVNKIFGKGVNSKLNLKEKLIIVLTIPAMYISDSKYLLLNLLIALFFTHVIIRINRYLKPILVILLVLFSIIIQDYLIHFSFRLSPRSEVNPVKIIENISKSAKYSLLGSTILLPFNEPFIFFIGSGPGTFLSRAANSRAYNIMEKRIPLGAGESVEVESKLPSFIPPFTSWVTYKYASHLFYIDWAGTLMDYRGNLISFLWEFGIVGFTFFILFFVKYSKKKKEQNKKNNFEYLFLTSFIIFFFLNSFLAYYFEYPYSQILFWSFLGLFSIKVKREFYVKKNKIYQIDT
ncbi:MAG: hypothetical protein ACTSRG_25930 [Candidatus Helarchaeota archaeon]